MPKIDLAVGIRPHEFTEEEYMFLLQNVHVNQVVKNMETVVSQIKRTV
jgi:hypothetical protein